MEEAETHKAAGNELFKAGSFEEAVKEYSRAIELNPDSPVYYSNRAMAYLQVWLPCRSLEFFTSIAITAVKLHILLCPSFPSESLRYT